MASGGLECIVQIVDEEVPNAGFGKVVLAVQGDELSADALELGQRDDRCGKGYCVFGIGD